MAHELLTDYAVSVVARHQQEFGPPVFEELGPVPAAEGIYWNRVLNMPGEHGCRAVPESLSDVVKDRLLHFDTKPCELWIFRGDWLVAAGPVIGYEPAGRGSVHLQAAGLAYYLAYMAVGPDTGTLSWTTPIDQAFMVQQLIDAWQGLAHGHFGLDTSAIAATGQTREGTFANDEPVLLIDLIRRISQRINGFDLDVDLTLDGGQPTRQVQIHYPRQGVARPNVSADARNIDEPSESMSVAENDIATEAWAFSPDHPSGGSLVGISRNPTLRAQFGRVAVWGTYDGVIEQTTIDDHAADLRDSRDGAAVVMGASLIPVSGVGPFDFDVGDEIDYSFDAGLGLRTLTRRVTMKAVRADASGAESIQAAFA